MSLRLLLPPLDDGDGGGLGGLGKGDKNEHILQGQKIEHILLGRLIEHILLGHTVYVYDPEE